METEKLLRRSRLWAIPVDTFFKLFDWRKGRRACLPIFPEDLRGATVRDVHFDFERCSFLIKLCREDWAEVPPGMQLPFIYSDPSQVCFDIPEEHQDRDAQAADFAKAAGRIVDGCMDPHLPPGRSSREVLDAWFRGYLQGGGKGVSSLLISTMGRELDVYDALMARTKQHEEVPAPEAEPQGGASAG